MTARAAQCGCGVHGFAMNPCVSLRLATAPYYREARVTVVWRQSACGMRHCCARRIVETGGRRELGCTSTRLAEQQRIIEAEANRIATPNAAPPRAGSAIGKHCSSLSCSPAMGIFSGRVQGRGISFRKRDIPPLSASPTPGGKKPELIVPKGTVRYFLLQQKPF